MGLERRRANRRLSLILAGSLALGGPGILSPSTAYAQETGVMATSENQPLTEDLCRQVFGNFLEQIVEDVSTAIPNKDLESVRNKYENFLGIFMSIGPFEEMPIPETARRDGSTSDAYVKAVFERRASVDRAISYITNHTRIITEVEIDEGSGEPTYTFKVCLGLDDSEFNEADYLQFYMQKTDNRWQVSNVVRDMEGTKDPLYNMYRLQALANSERQKKVEKRRQQILSNMKSNGWDIEELQRRQAAGESISDLIEQARRVREGTNQSTQPIQGQSESIPTYAQTEYGNNGDYGYNEPIARIGDIEVYPMYCPVQYGDLEYTITNSGVVQTNDYDLFMAAFPERRNPKNPGYMSRQEWNKKYENLNVDFPAYLLGVRRRSGSGAIDFPRATCTKTGSTGATYEGLLDHGYQGWCLLNGSKAPTNVPPGVSDFTYRWCIVPGQSTSEYLVVLGGSDGTGKKAIGIGQLYERQGPGPLVPTKVLRVEEIRLRQ
jgi:hypothetical protein